MLSDKVTIVYSTSPHRFGESTAMINLSIQTLKEYGFRDCHFIICADGINKESRYGTEEETKKYNQYIKNLNKLYKEENVTILKSKENIGLTLNYMQAWKQNKINTEYVFFMNHDAAINPGFYLINMEKIIDSFPDDAKTLIFARDDTDFWKKWFSPKEHDIVNGEWKHTYKCFAFQDNACLMKAETFPFYVQKFYNPDITKFLEDSLQERLRAIANRKDQSEWKTFGTYVWNRPLTFHLDGQSKANNHRFSEKVWSKGFCYSKNLKKLQEHTEERSELWVAVNSFVEKETEIQSDKIMDNFIDFSSRLLNFTKLHFGPTENITEISSFDSGFFANIPPQRSNDYKQKLHITENSIKINWEPCGKNLVAKVTCEGNQIAYGGHNPGQIEIPFEKFPSRNCIIDFCLEEFGEDNYIKQEILNEKIDLSLFTITPDFLNVAWKNFPPANLNIFLTEGESIGSAKRQWMEGPQQYLLDFTDKGLLYGQTFFLEFLNKKNEYRSWRIAIDVPCGYEYDYSTYQKVELIIKNVHKNLVNIMPQYAGQNIDSIIRKLH